MTDSPAVAPTGPWFVAAAVADDITAAEHCDHPAAAFSAVVDLLDRHPTTTGAWCLTPEWPDAVTVVVRLRPDLGVGESRRHAHQIELAPGVWQTSVLTARCGLDLDIVDLEFLPGISGMPCPFCVRATAEQETQ